MNKKILIIAAHPDDEILGCGATAARHYRQGNEVFCLILSRGILSRYRKPDKCIRTEIKILNERARQAHAIIGIKKSFFCDFPDNRFDTVARLHIIQKIEMINNKIKPDVIYTHYRNDLNIDHRIAYESALTACRPIGTRKVREFYTFEIPSSTEWMYPVLFSPDVFVDVEPYVSTKLKAMECYRTEMRKSPHPRSLQSLLNRLKFWGIASGLGYAEAFEAVRILISSSQD